MEDKTEYETICVVDMKSSRTVPSFYHDFLVENKDCYNCLTSEMCAYS